MHKTFVAISILILPVVARASVTARVGDVTRLKGQGINYLTGMGLVVGLDGTGDGDDYAMAMRPLAQALSGFYANPVTSMEELKDTKNVAIVFLEATLPESGAREGSQIDVQVSTFGSAKSLRGGRLLPAPLLYPDRNVDTVFAMAAGKVMLPDDQIATSGTIQNGAVVLEDVVHAFTAPGRDLPFSNSWVQPHQTYVTLVIDDNHASWTLAREIAQAIDSALALAADVEHVALAADLKNVLVLVPESQVGDPADWISQIEEVELLISSGEARVVVNRTSGTIVVSGNAKVSPVIVSHRGLTITVSTIQDESGLTLAEPQVQQFIALDPGRKGGTNLSDLLEALNRLNVPIDDRISILTQIHGMGALHARLIVRD
ncbi:MAG TPA: flagellar basal body P-ring protein FlgI [Phycisphaerae bacterium]|nr:flagellar basal body P-ring protein FlgI [Phycisphaerae bacterium]